MGAKNRISIKNVGINNDFGVNIVDLSVGAPLPFGNGLVSVSNLSAYYKCDEASGNLIDLTSNGLNLTQNGGIGSAAGKISTCRTFASASSQYASRVSSLPFQSGGSDFTVALWFNRTSSVNYAGLVTKYNGSANGEYALYQNGAEDKLRWGITSNGGGITDQVDSAITLTNGTWNFVIAWIDSVAKKIWISVNGETPVSATYITGTTSRSLGVNIGTLTGGGYFWDGKIDEISIWKRVLTTAERAALYNNGSGLTY